MRLDSIVHLRDSTLAWVLGRVHTPPVTTHDYSKCTRGELIARVRDLERAEAERSAAVSVVDAKFKAVFEQGLLFMGITDLDGRLLEVNKLALEVCGFRREDVLGIPVWQTGWFNQIPGLADNVKLAVQEAAAGRTFRADIPYSWADGSEHFANFILLPIKDADGRVIYLSPIGFDITERRQIEAALQERERLLKLVTDGTPALISYVDTEMRYRSVNKQWLEWFMRRAEDVTGRTVEEVVGYEGWDVIRPNALRALAGESLTFERQLLHRDGSLRWLEITYTPDRDETGRVRGFVANAYDMTRRKLAEDNLSLLNVTLEQQVVHRTEKLADSERRLRALFDQVGVGVVEADVGMNGRLCRANKFFCNMVGFSEVELQARTVADISHPDVIPANTEKWRQLLAGEIREFDIEKKYICKDGGIVWGHTIVSPLWQPGETPTRVVAIVQNITAQKAIEVAKAEAELHYRTIFEEAGVGVAELDSRSGRFIVVNHKNLGMLGYTREEMLALTFMDITHPDDLVEDVANMERMMSGQTSGFAMEKRLLRKDKSVIWVNLNVSALWQPGEAVTTHIAVVKDITERKRAERELSNSRDQLHTVMENMTEGMVIATMDGFVTYWNPASIRMFGFSSLSDVQKHLSEFATLFEITTLNGQLLALEHWPLSRVLRHEKVLNLELNVRRLDKPWEMNVSYNGEIVRDSSGEELAYLTFSDITERKRSEQEYLESQQRLDLALSGTDAGVWDWNVKTGVVKYDERWTAMLGYTLAEVEMEFGFWEKRVHPDDLPGVLVELNAHLTGENPDYRVEHRLRHKDGSWVWVQSTGRVVEWDTAGKPYRACGTHLNITERKKMEATLVASEKLAATGRLAAGIAHEINNPLNGIKNCFRLVKDALPPEDSVQRYAGLIDREIDRIATIVRRMFTLYRPGKTNSSEFSVSQLVKDTVDLIQPALSARNQKIVVVAPETSAAVFLPEANLSEILHNVIRNAVDASPDGGTVEITYRVSAAKLFLTITDHGEGIPEEQWKHIFEPFYTTKLGTPESGMGLGLALVRANVELLHGRIWFESKPDTGTTFHVELPERIENVAK